MAEFNEIKSILGLLQKENKVHVKDFSYDIYCPKTYSHHTRLTFWQPPFYLRKYTYGKLKQEAISLLRTLGVRRSANYVVGINSRVNQYDEQHILLLDFDSKNREVINALRSIPGFLFISGRGIHFIGRKLLLSNRSWQLAMQKIQSHKILGKYIDRKFVEFSLARGYGTLRITRGTGKPHVPHFLEET